MGGIAIMAWSAANMFLLYLILCRLKLHRVHRSSEKIGKTLRYFFTNYNLCFVTFEFLPVVVLYFLQVSMHRCINN